MLQSSGEDNGDCSHPRPYRRGTPAGLDIATVVGSRPRVVAVRYSAGELVGVDVSDANIQISPNEIAHWSTQPPHVRPLSGARKEDIEFGIGYVTPGMTGRTAVFGQELPHHHALCIRKGGLNGMLPNVFALTTHRHQETARAHQLEMIQQDGHLQIALPGWGISLPTTIQS